MGFAAQLASYQKAINADIAACAAQVKNETEVYGKYPSTVTDEFLDLLLRSGKRLRGTLAMVGYEMLGGRNGAMIVRAAAAIEMLHASMLIIDDIQDHDTMRRDKLSVHAALAVYHKKLGMRGDAGATGVSLAINAALVGWHTAETLLADLDIGAEIKNKVLGTVNQTVVLTLHGQTYDIINQGLKAPKAADVARATEWKSAHYTFLNPLCVGMMLAGADRKDTGAIRDYALNAGVAFQLTDDLMDGDIKPTDVAAARKRAAAKSQRAVAALAATPANWNKKSVGFLSDLARFVISNDKKSSKIVGTIKDAKP